MMRAGFALLLALLVAACGEKDAVLKPTPLKAYARVVSVDAIWDRKVGQGARTQGLRLQPALSGPDVIVAGDAGRVVCLSRAEGKRRWRVDLRAELAAGPTVAYNQVFVGTRKGEVMALSAENGHELWRAALSSEVLAPPAVGSDLVVVRTVDGRVSALERATGKPRWNWQGVAPTLALRALSRPELLTDAVLVGLSSGELVALTRDEGQVIWQRRIAEPSGKSELDRLVDIAADVAMSGDLLFVATYQGRLVAMDLRSGQFTWQQPLSSYRAVSIGHDTVYAVDADSRVVAFGAADGTVIWRQEALMARSLTAAVPLGDNLLVGDFDGYVHVIRQADGELVGRLRVGTEPIVADPLVDDGSAWVVDRTGRVTALAFAPWDSVPHVPDLE